jgi:hypothetical protein
VAAEYTPSAEDDAVLAAPALFLIDAFASGRMDPAFAKAGLDTQLRVGGEVPVVLRRRSNGQHAADGSCLRDGNCAAVYGR